MKFLNKCTRLSFLGTFSRINQCVQVQGHPNALTCVRIRKKDENVQLYPTRLISLCVREFGSSNITRKSENGIKSDEIRVNRVIPYRAVTQTFLFFVQYNYYTKFRDANIAGFLGGKTHARFGEGVTMAFSYISECLLAREYNQLDELLTPELIQTIKQSEMTIRAPVGRIFETKLTDLKLRYNAVSKENELEVIVYYSYSLLDDEQTYLGTSCLVFLRTYGENKKKSNWIVNYIKNDVSSFTLLDHYR